MELSPQEHQRRSDLARRMHAEGKLGQREAQSRGGRERARRASVLAQRLVTDHEDAVEAAFLDALLRGTAAQRARTAEAMLRLALASERAELDAEPSHEPSALSREELIEVLAQKLTRGPAAALIAARLEQQTAR